MPIVEGQHQPQLPAIAAAQALPPATGMTDAPHPLAPIESALDRFREAHFWIHTLEEYYHLADPFRWHLNAFLKSIKEVPQLIQMGLQNRPGFSAWFREERDGRKKHAFHHARPI